jgi:hypothetical protein
MEILPNYIFNFEIERMISNTRGILLSPVILDTGSVRVPDRGIWETFEKAVSRNRVVGQTHWAKKVSHFQTFGLGVFLFTANAANEKELREGNRREWEEENRRKLWKSVDLASENIIDIPGCSERLNKL